MRITSESFTVLPRPADGEITLLIGGLKIVLDLNEARALTAQLVSGMESIAQAGQAAHGMARTGTGLTLLEPVLVLPTSPPEGSSEEPAKKPTTKLRSLFKALVKEDDNSF